MAKKMYADNSVVTIYEGSDSVITNPLGRLQDVYFHSDLSYMEVVQRATVFVTLQGGNGDRFDLEPVYTHGLGTIPLVTGFIKTLNVPLTGSVVLDVQESPVRYREVYIGADSNQIAVFQLLQREPETNYANVQLEIELFIYGVS